MRASLVRPAAGLKKDHRVSEWFWDHEVGFCRRHNERERKQQEAYITSCVMRVKATEATPNHSLNL